MRQLFAAITVVFLWFSFSNASEIAQVGKPAPEFDLLGVDGKKYSLEMYKGKTVVLEWLNFGCPFVKKHYNSGNMQKLQTEYTAKGIVWLAICSSAEGKQGHMEAGELKNILKEKGFAANAYLLDASGKAGRLYAAKTTPHMFVINNAGILVYDGAIDDIPTAKISDLAKAKTHIKPILDDLLKGKSVAGTQNKPYGCSVKY